MFKLYRHLTLPSAGLSDRAFVFPSGITATDPVISVVPPPTPGPAPEAPPAPLQPAGPVPPPPPPSPPAASNTFRILQTKENEVSV